MTKVDIGFWQRFFHLMREFRLHLVWDVLKTCVEFLSTYLGLSTATIVGFVMLAVRWFEAHRYSDSLFISGVGLSATSILLLGIKIGMKLSNRAKREPELAPAQTAAATSTADAPKEPEKSVIVLASDEQVMRFDPKVSAIERRALQQPDLVTSESRRSSARSRFAGLLVLLLSIGIGTMFITNVYWREHREAPSPVYSPIPEIESSPGPRTYPRHSPSGEAQSAKPRPLPRVEANPEHSEKNSVKVWADTASGLYHCRESYWYGTTTEGKYMSQAEARAEGYHPAYDRPCQWQRGYSHLYFFLGSEEVQKHELQISHLADKLAQGSQPSEEEARVLISWIGDVNNAVRYGCGDVLDTAHYHKEDWFISGDIREKLENRKQLSDLELRSLAGWLKNGRQAIDICRSRVERFY